ncbi:MAG: PqqD family protein [Thermoanaerobaculia bacterium]
MTRRIAGETIVVPIRARAAELDAVYVLNEVGAAIWNQLDEGRSPAEITATIAAEFDVSAETALRDVEQFLERLLEAGIVEGQVS